MKLNLDTKKFAKGLLSINDQSVRVGVLNRGKKANNAKRPLNKLALTNKVKRNAATTKGSGKNPKLIQIMAMLNKEHGMLDKALEVAGNKEILELADLFVELGLDKKGDLVRIRRIQNLCRAIVRNPILRKEYGNNKPSTVKSKGFDQLGINTGTLFKNIEARYGHD